MNLFQMLKCWLSGKKCKTNVELQNKREIEYFLNDPTTPNLKKVVKTLPKSIPNLPFLVKGMKDGVPTNSIQLQAVNCYITLANCTAYVDKWLRWYGNPLKRWAAVKSLNIVPRAGKMLNAYYDRRGLKFFYETNPKDNSVIFTADSTDIVSHEMGHALLDALRPDFWSVQALEIWSFHESWADITAMVSIMQHDEILQLAIEETNGDLSNPNVICRLAEQMGQIIYDLTGGEEGYDPTALRDASVVFKYVDPKTLPVDGPNNTLVAECHSFGRTFLSAWYHIMIGIYNHELKRGKAPIAALKLARDNAFKLLVGAVIKTPCVNLYYEAVSKLMIRMTKKQHAEYLPIITGVLTDWNFIRPEVKMMSNVKVEDLIAVHGKDGFDEDLMTLSVQNTKTIKLADYIPKGFVSAMSVGEVDLAQLEIEVPTGNYYEFDLDGNLVDMIEEDLELMTDDARMCALAIQNEMNLGPDDETMWEVVGNKLVRTFIE